MEIQARKAPKSCVLGIDLERYGCEMTNILVCDDDKEIVDAIAIYLEQEGYHIRKAYDGEEAIQILKEEDIQIKEY